MDLRHMNSDQSKIALNIRPARAKVDSQWGHMSGESMRNGEIFGGDEISVSKFRFLLQIFGGSPSIWGGHREQTHTKNGS